MYFQQCLQCWTNSVCDCKGNLHIGKPSILYYLASGTQLWTYHVYFSFQRSCPLLDINHPADVTAACAKLASTPRALLVLI